jgi:sugar phosphate isomerase/epimerase
VTVRLGACTHTYVFACGLEEALHRLAEFGFSHVTITATPPHIWPRDFGAEDRASLRDLLNALDLELLGVNPTSLDLNLASTNPGVRDETIAQIKELTELTRDLDSKVLEITGGKLHFLVPPPHEEAWELASDSIRQCVEHAEEVGVTLALENVPGGFINTAQRMKRMAEEIGSDNLKIMYDVANAHLTPDEAPLAEALGQVADKLAYIHVSDNDGQTMAHLPVGAGTIDFGAVAQALNEIGFDGVAVIETAYPHDPDRSFADSIEALKQFGWRP